MGAAHKSACAQKTLEKEQLKQLDEMLDIKGLWMVDLSERFSLPFQYIAEMVTEDH